MTAILATTDSWPDAAVRIAALAFVAFALWCLCRAIRP